MFGEAETGEIQRDQWRHWTSSLGYCLEKRPRHWLESQWEGSLGAPEGDVTIRSVDPLVGSCRGGCEDPASEGLPPLSVVKAPQEPTMTTELWLEGKVGWSDKKGGDI